MSELSFVCIFPQLKISTAMEPVDLSAPVQYTDGITVRLGKCRDRFYISSWECGWKVIFNATFDGLGDSAVVWVNHSEGDLCGLC